MEIQKFDLKINLNFFVSLFIFKKIEVKNYQC